MTEHKLICPWCGDCRIVQAYNIGESARTIRQICSRCSSTRDLDHQAGHDKYHGHHSNPKYR